MVETSPDCNYIVDDLLTSPPNVARVGDVLLEERLQLGSQIPPLESCMEVCVVDLAHPCDSSSMIHKDESSLESQFADPVSDMG